MTKKCSLIRSHAAEWMTLLRTESVRRCSTRMGVVWSMVKSLMAFSLAKSSSVIARDAQTMHLCVRVKERVSGARVLLYRHCLVPVVLALGFFA